MTGLIKICKLYNSGPYFSGRRSIISVLFGRKTAHCTLFRYNAMESKLSFLSALIFLWSTLIGYIYVLMLNMTKREHTLVVFSSNIVHV